MQSKAQGWLATVLENAFGNQSSQFISVAFWADVGI